MIKYFKFLFIILLSFAVIFGFSGKITANAALTEKNVKIVASQFTGAFSYDNGMATMMGSTSVFGLGKMKNNSGFTNNVGNSKQWAMLAANDDSFYGIKKDGTLWAWGAVGSLLDQEKDEAFKPAQVGSDTDWISVSNGANDCEFVYFLKSDGRVFGFGNNGNNQLLLGNKDTGYEPDLVLVHYNAKKGTLE